VNKDDLKYGTFQNFYTEIICRPCNSTVA